MSWTSQLEKHPALAARREQSEKALRKVREKLLAGEFFNELPVAIFCAGSLARSEIGVKSDLDVFVTADHREALSGHLCESTLFDHLAQLNGALGYPPFSNDGEYLKVHCIDELKRRTGSRKDDSENLFTVRMLLMLESQYLFDSCRYCQHLEKIIDHYYRDEKGKESFRPLFLLNDVLRYWRTLCLNDEERRNERYRPWRKKNINLKFSRMLTVFATILPLVAEPVITPKRLLDYCRLSPLQRLASAIDQLNNSTLTSEWPEVMDIYAEFLSWKEDDDIEKSLRDEETKRLIAGNAAKFSDFLHRALSDDSIRPELRRYLIL